MLQHLLLPCARQHCGAPRPTAIDTSILSPNNSRNMGHVHPRVPLLQRMFIRKQQPHALYHCSRRTFRRLLSLAKLCGWCCCLLFSPRISLALSHNQSPAHPDSGIVRERSRSPTSWHRFKDHIINCLGVNPGQKKRGERLPRALSRKKMTITSLNKHALNETETPMGGGGRGADHITRSTPYCHNGQPVLFGSTPPVTGSTIPSWVCPLCDRERYYQ